MLYFFINPASRSGRGLIQWEKTKKYLKQNKIPYEAHMLKDSISPRPVMETIFEKEEGIVSIVLIGGDGTINQCVNAVPDLNRLELSVIPTGSGNDFCRNKPIPTSLEEQIQNILEKKNHMYIDRGREENDLSVCRPIGRKTGNRGKTHSRLYQESKGTIRMYAVR